jgi:membrane-bound acyltransferase YfiQ involved in biofilm formation
MAGQATSLDLLSILTEYHNDMENILPNLQTTMAISMLILVMKMVMQVEVSSEMMMIGSQEMFQVYLLEQYKSSISSISEQKREHISGGILLKTQIISLFHVSLFPRQQAENS